MKSFNEYILEREELNEDLGIGVAAMTAILGLPTAAVAAYGGSLLVKGYSKFLSSIMNKIIKTWKLIFRDIKNIGNREVVEVIREKKENPYVRKYLNEEDKTRRIYEEELNKVYKAIEKQDFDTARNEFKSVDKKIRNHPDVKRMIISEISKSLKEPPLYVGNTGNKTYLAIKKVLDIQTARAAAEATKISIEEGLKK